MDRRSISIILPFRAGGPNDPFACMSLCALYIEPATCDHPLQQKEIISNDDSLQIGKTLTFSPMLARYLLGTDLVQAMHDLIL
jgi:hypothetical protein